MLAALAADAPEITSAVTALSQHQQKVGAGVIIGSNVFNLAALLGLGAVVAGSIALHRKVVLLGGVVGIWIAAVCLVTVTGAIPPGGRAWPRCSLVLVPVPDRPGRRAGPAWAACPIARRWEAWLAVAISEEEQELDEVIHPPHGRRVDVLLGGRRPGGRGAGQRGHGAGSDRARHPLRGAADHHRRAWCWPR